MVPRKFFRGIFYYADLINDDNCLVVFVKVFFYGLNFRFF